MYFLGIDIGSSSVKLSVLNGATGRSAASAQYPAVELEIASPQKNWAEQDPATWWECVTLGCQELWRKGSFSPKDIAAIGITYQMHGLVIVDKDHQVLRPAIIWCDSRAVEVGDKAFQSLGSDYCLTNLLNSPGNFTASKLRWVQENEPEIYRQIHKILLPGDYIALKLSGETSTSPGGLSEGILWDFQNAAPAHRLMDHWQLSHDLIPTIEPNIGGTLQVNAQAAEELGISAGIPISYRAGDQPSNAFSLNVLNPGEIAANAGTSGVIYAVTDQPITDEAGRVNTFLHVTHTETQPRNGILLCVNGTGRAYGWLRQILSAQGVPLDYGMLNQLASQVAIGSDGVQFVPFGNGAERMFQNKTPGAHIHNIDLNRHSLGHLVRATQEGIVFALNYGFDVIKELGGRCDLVRAPRGNMFLSDIFTQAFANTTGSTIELYETDGAEGAARGAALGCGYYASETEAFGGLALIERIEPNPQQQAQYQDAYQKWSDVLPDTL